MIILTMSNHKIYLAEISRLEQIAIIITTAHTNSSGYLRAESFLLIPGTNKIFAFTRLRVDVKSFNDSPIKIDEIFMLEEALAQAKLDLGKYIEAQYEDKAKKSLQVSQELHINDRDLELLAHIWVRGIDEDAIRSVCVKTENTELKKSIQSIMQLPNISRELMRVN